MHPDEIKRCRERVRKYFSSWSVGLGIDDITCTITNFTLALA